MKTPLLALLIAFCGSLSAQIIAGVVPVGRTVVNPGISLSSTSGSVFDSLDLNCDGIQDLQIELHAGNVFVDEPNTLTIHSLDNSITVCAFDTSASHQLTGANLYEQNELMACQLGSHWDNQSLLVGFLGMMPGYPFFALNKYIAVKKTFPDGSVAYGWIKLSFELIDSPIGVQIEEVLCLPTAISTQHTSFRTLFLGNSYTYVNDLPTMVSDIATSMGDTFHYDSNTPGGYTLQGHSTDATSLAKIQQGNWDYVVLQEQSQRPSFPIAQVEADVFPYAHALDSIINYYNPCAETAFYMTWGRKNGDASNCAFYPPLCTYQGMDSLLNLRYRMMADDNDAILSPVGAVWKYIRQHFPTIELYSADESHPSLAGTYAAACSFYTAFFRKDPLLIPFNSSLSAADAANIRTAVKAVVYDSLLVWHIGEYDPKASFSFTAQSNSLEVGFVNTSSYADSYSWDFGDGNTSTLENPVHNYTQFGIYNVTLTVERCGNVDSFAVPIFVQMTGIEETKQSSFKVYPNPVRDLLTVCSDIFMSNRCRIKIYNSLGVLVLNAENISSREKVLDLSGLNAGVYFLAVQNENGSVYSMLVEKI